jgi:hypothetical protein
MIPGGGVEEIQLERTGRILVGNSEDYFLRIHHDECGTGGYYVMTLDDLDLPTSGGDDWVATIADLENYFVAARWVIDWLDPGHRWWVRAVPS